MSYHLAELNIATFKTPIEDPANADFVGALDRVNAIAEAQPGFVWRLVGDGNNALDVRAFEDPKMAVNLSLWRDLESLAAFVYRNDAHRDIMRRRREWFERMDFYLALWWVPVGTVPTVEDAVARLEHLKTHGPSPRAFTFRQPFPADPNVPVSPILDECA